MSNKKVLTSFGFGNQSELLRITIPTFLKYAQTHSYDLFIPSEEFFSKETKTRHYSWWKIELITRLFDKYDRVLWLDADVVACHFSKDIFDEMDSQSHVGMVVHKVPIGYVPNCGVWVLDKKCMAWLPELWQYNNLPRSDGWWEQDAMLHKLGIDSGTNNIKLPESFPIPWTQLSYGWNPHVHDIRGIPERLMFFHATMFNNRPQVMSNVVSQLDI
jgi:hypothetical protein